MTRRQHSFWSNSFLMSPARKHSTIHSNCSTLMRQATRRLCHLLAFMTEGSRPLLGRLLDGTPGRLLQRRNNVARRVDTLELDAVAIGMGVHHREPDEQRHKHKSAQEYNDIERLVVQHVHEE